MEGRWQSLRIGDRVRYIRIPGQSVPGYYMHEDTRRLFERLIEERVVITIASIDDFGTPWARCFVVTLLEALDYLALLAELRPDRVERAAVRWHGRLELEASILTLAESQFALAALANLPSEGEAIEVLRRLVRRTQPTLIPKLP